MSNDEKIVFENIERLGDKYIEKHLSEYLDAGMVLETNWWDALVFFFGHSFMRGRRDELSNEYQCFTIEVLKDYLSISEGKWDKSFQALKENNHYLDSKIISSFKKKYKLGNQNAVKDPRFDIEVKNRNPLVKLLTTKRRVKVTWGEDYEYTKDVLLGNDKDIMMVLDTLRFVVDNDRKNIYRYLTSLIKKNGLEKAYDELDQISNVGDKIAAFTIRDIGLINPDLIDKLTLTDSDYELAFPVDTWVAQITSKIIKNGTVEPSEIKKFLVRKCLEFGLNPLKVAAGLWYLGFNSLDILLDKMKNEKIQF